MPHRPLAVNTLWTFGFTLGSADGVHFLRWPNRAVCLPNEALPQADTFTHRVEPSSCLVGLRQSLVSYLICQAH
jgi:hypothetical protein